MQEQQTFTKTHFLLGLLTIITLFIIMAAGMNKAYQSMEKEIKIKTEKREKELIELVKKDNVRKKEMKIAFDEGKTISCTNELAQTIGKISKSNGYRVEFEEQTEDLMESSLKFVGESMFFYGEQCSIQEK